MHKWEYKLVPITKAALGGIEYIQEQLNELGQKEWELIDIIDKTLILKRPS